jgi:hypothetical protein
MEKTIDYEQRLKNLKSLSAKMYCQYTGKEETRDIRFFGRAIDFTIIMHLINVASSGAPSPLVYTAATCFLGSYTIYLAEQLFASGKNVRAFAILSLLLVLGSLAVGYSIYTMTNIIRNAEEVSVNASEGPTEINELLTYETSSNGTRALEANTLTSSEKVKNDFGSEVAIQEIDISQIEVDSETEETFKQYASLISADPIQDSEAFLDKYDELILKAPESVDLILVRAIAGGLDTDHLLVLLNRGGELNGGHLSILLTNRSLEEIKLLENYGLDIQQNTLSGRDVLADALLNSDREAVFDYLVLNRELDQSSASQTLVDVITRSEQLKLGDSYIKKLIDKGASLTDNDRKLVKEMSQNNPEFYGTFIDSLQI